MTLVKGMLGKDDLPSLIHRVAFPKNTHYGHYFEVETKDDPSNLAYTSGTLGLHLDLGFYNYTPGVREGRLNKCTEKFRKRSNKHDED